MKRAFIIHGWDGYPEECWFPWLRKELELLGLTVAVPQLPDPSHPSIQTWAAALGHAVGSVDSDTFLIGHSTGCAAILHYLETQPDSKRVGGIVLVGPWLTKLKTLELEAPEDRATAQAWLSTPIQWSKIRAITSRIVGIFSDNDPYVDLADADLLKRELGAKIILEHDLGHMGPDVNCVQLPSALRAVMEMVQS